MHYKRYAKSQLCFDKTWSSPLRLATTPMRYKLTVPVSRPVPSCCQELWHSFCTHLRDVPTWVSLARSKFPVLFKRFPSDEFVTVCLRQHFQLFRSKKDLGTVRVILYAFLTSRSTSLRWRIFKLQNGRVSAFRNAENSIPAMLFSFQTWVAKSQNKSQENSISLPHVGRQL